MGMSIPLMVISIVLFFILFFGLGFILNMLFRKTWIMAVIYPIIALYITRNLKLSEYFLNFSSSMSYLLESTGVGFPDLIMGLFLPGQPQQGLLVFVALGEGGDLFVNDAFRQLVLLHPADDAEGFVR